MAKIQATIFFEARKALGPLILSMQDLPFKDTDVEIIKVIARHVHHP